MVLGEEAEACDILYSPSGLQQIPLAKSFQRIYSRSLQSLARIAQACCSYSHIVPAHSVVIDSVISSVLEQGEVSRHSQYHLA